MIKILTDSLKVLQRDPDITATSFDDSDLSNALREEDMQRKNAAPP